MSITARQSHTHTHTHTHTHLPEANTCPAGSLATDQDENSAPGETTVSNVEVHLNGSDQLAVAPQVVVAGAVVAFKTHQLSTPGNCRAGWETRVGQGACEKKIVERLAIVAGLTNKHFLAAAAHKILPLLLSFMVMMMMMNTDGKRRAAGKPLRLC